MSADNRRFWFYKGAAVHTAEQTAVQTQLRVLQSNGVLGDWAANVQQLTTAAEQAQRDGVACLVPPALALCGSPVAGDYVLRPSFLAAVQTALHQLISASTAWPDVALVLSYPAVQDGVLVHAVSVVRNGAQIAHGGQQHLQGDAALLRHCQPMVAAPCQFSIGATRLAVLLGQDALTPACVHAAAACAQVIVALPLQAFYAGQPQALEAALAAQAQAVQRPVVSSQWAGGFDHWVFAGGSVASNRHGHVVQRLEYFVAACADITIKNDDLSANSLYPVPEPLCILWQALVQAVRDYVEKNRFPGVLLGLSGGIDSALVLAIAVDALGPQRVRTVMMPSPYTADISWKDAQAMADGLGVRHDVIEITPQVQAFETALAPLFAGTQMDTTEENLQARCRGTLLMALSNKFGHVVLTTSNKSEVAMGYGTLYGDMAGGFAVLCDVWKTEVFALARWRNAHDPLHTGWVAPIPERIITRPPSAELRPDQKDEDSLPPYEVLDALLRQYLEHNASPAQLEAAGYAPEVVAKTLRLLRLSEYKRRQGPGGPRLSPTAFARDWQIPMTHRFTG